VGERREMKKASTFLGLHDFSEAQDIADFVLNLQNISGAASY